MFVVQDSIARMVLERLRVKLGGTQTVAHRGTPNLEAYDLYLRARYQFNKFEEGPLRESIKLYDKALELGIAVLDEQGLLELLGRDK